MTGVQRLLLLIALILGASVGVAAQELPEELKHLKALEIDQVRLVDTARRFHLQQQSLIDWDLRMIDEYSRQGETVLAQEKQRELQHRLELVETQWKWILARYPNDARANNFYGEFLYDYDGNQAAGLKHWLTAVKLDDECAPAHNNLGIHYFHTGNYAEGLNHLQRALELDEDSPDYLYNMAQMYFIHFHMLEPMLKLTHQEIYKEAMKMSKKASQLAPDDFDIVQDYAVNFFAAENFGVEADWSDAAEAWRRARPLARNEAEKFYCLLNEGRAWIRSSEPQNAVQPLEDALAMDSGNDVAKQLLAKARGQAR